MFRGESSSVSRHYGHSHRLAREFDRGSRGAADLVGYVWSGICDVSASFCKDSLVIVTIKEGVLDLFGWTTSI